MTGLSLEAQREARRMPSLVSYVLDFTGVTESGIRILLGTVSIKEQQFQIAVVVFDDHQIAFA